MLKFGTSTHLTGDYVHYYSKDPAFDTDAEAFNYELWRDTGDEKHLPCKAGEKPSKFTLRRLSPEQYAFFGDRQLEAKGGVVQASVWLVRMALRKVEPIPDGLPAWELVTKYGFEVVGDEWTRLLQGVEGGELFGELVSRVMEETAGSPRD